MRMGSFSLLAATETHFMVRCFLVHQHFQSLLLKDRTDLVIEKLAAVAEHSIVAIDCFEALTITVVVAAAVIIIAATTAVTAVITTTVCYLCL